MKHQKCMNFFPSITSLRSDSCSNLGSRIAEVSHCGVVAGETSRRYGRSNMRMDVAGLSDSLTLEPALASRTNDQVGPEKCTLYFPICSRASEREGTLAAMLTRARFLLMTIATACVAASAFLLAASAEFFAASAE